MVVERAQGAKVALIYAGGTLGMELKAGKLVASNLDASLPLPDAWLVKNNISLTYIEKPPIDSAAIDASFFVKLAKLLRALAKDHTSLVVLQGTDTMEFSASATAFLCRDIKIPIIFTGAQLPIFYPNSDAQTNIQQAILWSLVKKVTGVNISFGNYLIKGVNSRKFSSKKFNAFYNFSTGILGEVLTDATSYNKEFVLLADAEIAENIPNATQVAETANLSQNISQILDLFCTRIKDKASFPHSVRIGVFPSICEDGLIKQCKDADLIFIEAYASGTVPKLPKFLDFLQKRIDAGVKVILLSQSLDTGIYQNEYATNLQANLAGVFSSANMTFATAYAKSLFLWLADIKEINKWRELWNTDFVGEFTLKNFTLKQEL